MLTNFIGILGMNLRIASLSLLISALILSGCNNDEVKKSPSQVVAKVNDKEITVLQINSILSRENKFDAETKKMVLDNLINQELLNQKAIELKLDRDPNVAMNIDFAKRQILAQAAINKLASPKKVSDSEVENYYAQHPEIFKERVEYNLSIFLVDAEELTADQLNLINGSNNNLATINILKDSKLNYIEKSSIKTSEQLPKELRDQIIKLKAGDILKYTENGKVVLVQLNNIEPKPVTLADSKNAIVNLLQQNESKIVVDAILSDLKNKAQIEVFDSSHINKPAIKESSSTNGLKGIN